MKRFAYLRPDTIGEAVAAGSQPGARFLAGGTNLLDLMKGDVLRPDRIVDLGGLPGMDRIEPASDGGVRIGGVRPERRSCP